MPRHIGGEAAVVSVIVPAYNESAIVVDTLTQLSDYMASLEDQYRWEIVVVNDGSTDDTGTLAEEFARYPPNVRILRGTCGDSRNNLP